MLSGEIALKNNHYYYYYFDSIVFTYRKQFVDLHSGFCELEIINAFTIFVNIKCFYTC